MAKFDDETPNFDDLDDLMSPGDELPPLEPDMAELPTELASREPMGIEELPVESDQSLQEQVEAQVSEAAEQPLEKSTKLPPHLEWIALAAVAVVVFALAFIHFVTFGTAIYTVSVAFVIYGIWKERETNTLFTVLLGCALIAVLTAVYCLWTELGRYHFNVSGKQARVSSSAQFDRAEVAGTLRVPSAVSFVI